MAQARRWWRSVAVLILLVGGCADSKPDLSAEQARNSACLHANGAVTLATGSEDPDWGPLIDSLALDQQLLADAGDEAMAETVGGVIEDLQSGEIQPLQISIYLSDDLSQSEIEELSAYLDEEPEVESHEYISREDAYDEFVEIYEDEPEFYEGLPTDALPASFRLRTAEDTDPDALVARLEDLEGVEQVRGQDDLFRKLAPLRPLLKLCQVLVPGETP